MEASITERLQKLRQWQEKQQVKLLKQQQVQREILSYERDCIYKALGISVDNLSILETTMDSQVTDEMEINTKEILLKNSDSGLRITEEEILTDANTLHEDHREETEVSNCVVANVDENVTSTKDYNSGILSQKRELSTDLLIEGIKPLSLNDAPNRCVSIDDIPISSSKKDFQALLEEKLRRETEVMPTGRTNSATKAKKPFLKKGQGLSRFKIAVNSHPPLSAKKCKVPLTTHTQRSDTTDKHKCSTINQDIHSKHVPSNNVPFIRNTQVLNLKGVPPPKKTIINKSVAVCVTPTKRTCHAISNGSRSLSEVNISDFDSTTERELEEVRIFELLEEKAENSSFCSTSSTVLAFLQQSTPFKIKERLRKDYTESKINTATSAKQQNNQEIISDMVEPLFEKSKHKLDIHKRSRARTVTIDSYWDTAMIDDRIQEEVQKHCLSMIDETSPSNVTHGNHLQNQDTPCDRRTNVESPKDNDEEEEISTKNQKLVHNDVDPSTVSHRVRFAEHNEYRTIDLINVSDKSLEYLVEEEDRNNRSSNTSEMSDDEENPSLAYEDSAFSQEVVGNEKTVNSSIQLSLGQEITENMYYSIVKALSVAKENNSPSCEDESSGEDTSGEDEYVSMMEKIVEMSDEERTSILPTSSPSPSPSPTPTPSPSLSPSSSPLPSPSPSSLSNARKTNMQGDESKKMTSKIERTHRTNTFGPELLKSRLLELEKEIDIFRKESAALLLQRQRLQEDQMTLRKEYTEKERNFEENTRRIQSQLEEEKKRLMREKVAMENRIRDAQEKAKQSKLERQKAQSLEEQIEKLRDELCTKESRWYAAESRYRSELRALRVEITKLKQEIGNLQEAKKTKLRNVRKTGGQVIAKAINQINKHITATSVKEPSTKTLQDFSNAPPKAFIRNDDNVENNAKNDEDKNQVENDRPIETIVRTIDLSSDHNRPGDIVPVNKRESKPFQFETGLRQDEILAEHDAVKKKRDLYENLLKDATSDLVESQNVSCITRSTSDKLRQSMPATQTHSSSAKSSDEFSSANENQPGITTSTTSIVNKIESYINRSGWAGDNHSEIDAKTGQNSSPEKKIYSSSFRQIGNGTDMKDGVKRVVHPDGRIEYWYPNGNVKKIFPDQRMTKMIYYNGDVRETDKNGRVKYFYATTRTWHTTTPDGVEILEFPDGQVEKHTTDGTIEVSFPDGSTRIAHADGTEKWVLVDGTIAQTFTNGDKILTLPNGQREVHTKAHKRREYPDGTVKLVYADGTQETRYSSGRKRLKDKDGNLVMDSYDS